MNTVCSTITSGASLAGMRETTARMAPTKPGLPLLVSSLLPCIVIQGSDYFRDPLISFNFNHLDDFIIIC